MKSDTTQMDLGIKPKATAAEWRAAAEACEQQFPCDAARLAYYMAKVEAAEQGQRPVAFVDLANWKAGLGADECFFTDWQDDDTIPLYVAPRPAVPEDRPLREVALRNLRKLIELGSNDKALMLSNLDEL